MSRAAAPAMANPWENEGFFSGEDGRQGQWGLGFQTPSYFDGSVFNVLTPTTILALSPVILLTVFLATVIFGVAQRLGGPVGDQGARDLDPRRASRTANVEASALSGASLSARHPRSCALVGVYVTRRGEGDVPPLVDRQPLVAVEVELVSASP